MDLLQLLWYALETLVIGAYFVLDGFDLGSGVLYPFIAKGEQEKSIVRRTIGPIWDGNEVWLLTAGGALFAAFAPAYATTFSGFYLAIMLVLLSLIIRAVSVEYASVDPKWHTMWHAFFFVGSLLPALLFGVAVGCVVGGVPLNAAGDYTGIPLFGLINPFSLCCGLLSLAVMICQGCAWLALKTPKDCPVQARAAKAHPIMIIISVVLFILTGLLYFVAVNHVASVNPALNTHGFAGLCQWVFVILIVVGAVVALIATLAKARVWAFLGTSLVPLALAGLLGATLFPNFVISTVDTATNTISLASAAAGDGTLAAMTVIACIGVPLVLIYHIIAYRIFRGRQVAENVNPGTQA
ncbi:MAG: cytochrome d ubiquinol oxidase subunit II [Coriobacteriales bacterium]|jgi:cytochrome d ubiquinol oxidase subunit II|nr:cytochrome d ubiquinol oxidase subunit II [Coriobacteriales bacterium]